MRISRSRLFVFLSVLCMSAAVSGCATIRHPVPPDLVDKVQIGDMDDIRLTVGESNTKLQENLLESVKQESAGDELEKLYTTMSTRDVMSSKGPFGALFGNSLANNRPLNKKVAEIFDQDLLSKIAAEHKRGRRLLVGTVNLDAQKFVVWDMGAIAARGDAELFRRVVIASAAIPVVFPPSIFYVEAGGKSYDEMHVDGGTLTQVFTTYKLLDGMQGIAKSLGINPSKIKAKLYILRNGYMSPSYKKVKDDLPSLAERSFDTIIEAQGVGDVYRIYVFTKQRGGDYNLACIPGDFKQDSKEMFDPQDMKRLFDRGYQDAVKGYKWHKVPPGLAEETPASASAAGA